MSATYTTNLNLAKPAYGDSADVGVINGNMDTLDGYCHDTRFMGAHAYDDQRTTAYAVGEYCIYLGHYYRCTGATSGAWDSTKWVQTTIGDELEDIASGQGVSDMTGATASTAGTHGLVPAPAAGDQDKVLMGSGTWENLPTPTTDLADLDDVDITTPTEGQILTYDGDDWVNADAPDVDVTKTAEGNPIEISDGANAPLVKCVSAITGSQDLHGYDKPWVGGAGKNKLPLVLADIKSANTSGTWSDNVYTHNGVTITVNADAGGNVTSIKLNGTASAVVDFKLAPSFTLSAGTYIASNEGSGTNYYGQIENGSTWSSRIVTDSPQTITYTADSIIYHYYVANGVTVSNIEVHPMIRLSTETDATFAPYTNICPITAYTEGEIEVSDGVNTTTHTTTYPSAIYRGSEDVVNGTVGAGSDGTLWIKRVFDGSADENWSYQTDNPFVIQITDLDVTSVATGSVIPFAICNIAEIYKESGNAGAKTHIISFSTSQYLFYTKLDITSESDFRAYLSNNPLEIAYKIATPTTESITPTNLPIKSLNGYNHIESSTGDLEIEYITQREQPIIDLITDTSQHIYSTAEKVVGEWIDGSTVYEKSYKVDNVVDDNNYVLDAELTQSAITLLPGTEVVISCTGTYNTDFTDCISNTTFGRVIANVNGLGASIVGYPQMATQLGTCTLYVTARYLKKTVSRSVETLSKGGSDPQEEPLVDSVDKVDKEVENDEKETQKEPVEEKEEPVEEEPVEEPSEEEEQNEAER